MSLVEQLARRLYAYDNPGHVPFEDAEPDVVAPYFDLAAIALDVFEEQS